MLAGLLNQISESQRQAQAVPSTTTALELLQAVYRNAEIPLSVRIRAATEALPFETPKLSATALVPMGEEFAKKLERAVGRSRACRLIEHSLGADD